jgi:hypothetical protein
LIAGLAKSEFDVLANFLGCQRRKRLVQRNAPLQFNEFRLI